MTIDLAKTYAVKASAATEPPPAAPAAPYDPASLKQATNLMNGETVSVATLHPPVRRVAGDPVKAAREAVAGRVRAG